MIGIAGVSHHLGPTLVLSSQTWEWTTVYIQQVVFLTNIRRMRSTSSFDLVATLHWYLPKKKVRFAANAGEQSIMLRMTGATELGNAFILGSCDWVSSSRLLFHTRYV